MRRITLTNEGDRQEIFDVLNRAHQPITRYVLFPSGEPGCSQTVDLPDTCLVLVGAGDGRQATDMAGAGTQPTETTIKIVL